MSKKARYSTILAAMMLSAMLAGCGDGTPVIDDRTPSSGATPDITMTEEPQQTTPEPVVTPEPPVGPELVYATGVLTEEEEAAVLEAMENLALNLELPDFISEGIHEVSSEEWFAVMTPNLYEGFRSYNLQKDGALLLTVQVGYDAAGIPFVNVFWQGAEGKLVMLKQKESKTYVLQTTVADGKYNGTFDRCLIDAAEGTIKWEQGTYSNNIIVGNYTVSVYDGPEGDVFDLWNNRENFLYETTEVEYDELGEIVPTPTPEPSPTPSPTPKPTTTPKPTATPTPAPTPAPTPEPELEPEVHWHGYWIESSGEPTCTAGGWKTYRCSCGDSYTDSIPATGHSFGSYSYNGDASYDSDGTETATCSGCGATDTRTASGTKLEPTPAPTPEPTPEPEQGDGDLEWSDDIL